MLDAGRFEVFPREVVVIDGELEDASRAGLHLAIDQHVALHYPRPSYFFVSRQRPELARPFARGLEKAIADGSLNGCSSDISRRRLESPCFGSGE